MNEPISEEELSTESIHKYIHNFYNGTLTARQELMLLTIAKLFPVFNTEEEYIFFDLLGALSDIYVDSIDDIVMYAQYTNKFVDSAINNFSSVEKAEQFIQNYDGRSLGDHMRMTVVNTSGGRDRLSKFRVLVVGK